MIKLIGSDLYQWDVDRRVSVDDKINEVHFACCLGNEALIVPVVDGMADIPNILLQRPLDINAWGVITDGGSSYTVTGVVLKNKARKKPSDYIYTETEVKRYENLERRIATLEEKEVDVEVIKQCVSDFLKDYPTVENLSDLKEDSEHRTVTDSEKENWNTKLDYSNLNDALAQAKESGLFDGEDGYTPQKGIDYFDGQNGKDGQNGEDGYTPVKGTDYFTEADKVEIAKQASQMVEVPEVDLDDYAKKKDIPNDEHINGLIDDKLEDFDVPTGGGGSEEWELITDMTLENYVVGINVDKDMNGESFNLKKACIRLCRKVEPNQGNTGGIRLCLDKNSSVYTSFFIANAPKSTTESLTTYATAIVEMITDNACVLSNCMSSYNGNSMTVETYKTSYNDVRGGLININGINKIHLGYDANGFGAGTTLKVYGVRK